MKCDNEEMKVALHKYEHGHSVREIEKKLTSGPASKLELLRNLLVFLNNEAIKGDIPKKKDDIAHTIECRIQNWLTDDCGICNKRYCLEINKEPFLPCSKCSQITHKECIINMIQPTFKQTLMNYHTMQLIL